jgi:hypothetical protein
VNIYKVPNKSETCRILLVKLRIFNLKRSQTNFSWDKKSKFMG